MDEDETEDTSQKNAPAYQRKMDNINLYKEKVKINVSKQEAIQFATYTQKNMIQDCIRNNLEYERQKYVLDSTYDEREKENKDRRKSEDPFIINISMRKQAIISRDPDPDGKKWLIKRSTLKGNIYMVY